LWADEAESALNALTIVADGVPGDRHMGLPLYENTLVRPWPESVEYEFRDAGVGIANEVRQASLASRKKRGTSGAV
jgi:hypothetical protein